MSQQEDPSQLLTMNGKIITAIIEKNGTCHSCPPKRECIIEFERGKSENCFLTFSRLDEIELALREFNLFKKLSNAFGCSLSTKEKLAKFDAVSGRSKEIEVIESLANNAFRFGLQDIRSENTKYKISIFEKAGYTFKYLNNAEPSQFVTSNSAEPIAKRTRLSGPK